MMSGGTTINIPLLLNSVFFISNLFIALGFIIKETPSQIANPAITSLFYLLLISLEYFSSFKLKNDIRLFLVLTLISHSFFGEYLRGYYTTGYFDNLLHAFGSFTFALLAFELLKTFLPVYSSKPALLTFMVVSLCGISLGTFYELAEFSLDQLLKEKNQFGLIDTDLDLFYDVLGSSLAGLFLVFKKIHL